MALFIRVFILLIALCVLPTITVKVGGKQGNPGNGNVDATAPQKGSGNKPEKSKQPGGNKNLDTTAPQTGSSNKPEGTQPGNANQGNAPAKVQKETKENQSQKDKNNKSQKEQRRRFGKTLRKREKNLERQFMFTGQGSKTKRVKEPKQRKKFFNLEREPRLRNKSRVKRAFKIGGTIWPNGIIPYEISNDFDNTEDLSKLKTWIEELNQRLEGCVTMRPAMSSDVNSLSITREKTGCHATIGYYSSHELYLNLQENDINDYGCIHQVVFEHEMGHVIGMYHEQSRSDRDNYVTIHPENVLSGHSKNFDKKSTMNIYPYDLESVMHYGKSEFAKSKTESLTVNDQRLDFLLQRGEYLQYYDIKDIVARYQCTEKCINPPACKFGSYLDGTCKCKCPEGLQGTHCDQPVAHDTTYCGNFLVDVSDGLPRTIQNPDPMSNGYSCTWIVKGVPGQNMTLTLEHLDLANNTEECIHFLEIRYNMIGQHGPQYCGKLNTEVKFISGDTPDIMMVNLNSENTAHTSSGFRWKVQLTNPSAGVTTLKPPATTPTTTTTTTTPTTTTELTTTTPTPGQPSEYMKTCTSSTQCHQNLQCLNGKCQCHSNFWFYWKESTQTCISQSCFFDYNAKDPDCVDFLRNKLLPTSWQLQRYTSDDLYAYFRPSSSSGDTSTLVSNYYEPGYYCVDLYLAIFGSDVTYFRIIQVTEGGQEIVVFDRSNYTSWEYVSANFVAYERFRVEFTASMRGRSEQISMDVVWVYRGACAGYN